MRVNGVNFQKFTSNKIDNIKVSENKKSKNNVQDIKGDAASNLPGTFKNGKIIFAKIEHYQIPNVDMAIKNAEKPFDVGIEENKNVFQKVKDGFINLFK